MIGVLGGSFDPIHFGHIKLLNELTEYFNFKEIRLIPTYQSPAKKTFCASSTHRKNMASIIANSDANNFVVDKAEIQRGGISYTYDTLKIIKKDRNIDDICLIMGLDVFLTFESWYNYLEILQEVNIIVLNRPDFDFVNINSMGQEIIGRVTKNRNDLLKDNKKHIFLYETAYIDISSTKIRNLISRGENPIGLIPGSIWSYIKRNKLYTEIYD